MEGGAATLEECSPEQRQSNVIKSISGTPAGSGSSINTKREHLVHVWYQITCLRPKNDKLDRSRYQDKNMCILLIPPPANGPTIRLRGALLLETGRPEVDAKLHLRYDCPLEYTTNDTAPTHDMLNGAPILSIIQGLSHNEILLECGACTFPKCYALSTNYTHRN